MCSRLKNTAILTLGVLSPLAAQVNSKPNIIIMQADDMGFDDMSYRGNTSIETPNLDKMSRESVSFEQFYVHSVSAPTRASLMTGRHFLRTGVYGVHGGRDFLNLEETTLAEVFKDAGYAVGMWGKWHLGKTDGYFPWDRGFDEAYMATLYHYVNNQGMLNGKLHPLQGWTDSIITDMAINFIKKHKTKPFLAYIPFLSPHGVWNAPSNYYNKYKQRGLSDNFAKLNGMIDHLDAQVGRIFKAVKDLGLEDNTILIFMSDNGPTRQVQQLKLTDEEWEIRNASHMKGSKGTNWENGIRSPLFIYWKDHYKPFSNNNDLICVSDIFPTLCDIANVKIPPKTKKLDGISFKQLIESPEKEDFQRDVFIAQFHPFFSNISTEGNIQYIPLCKENIEHIEVNKQMIGIRSGDYKLLFNQWHEQPISFRNISDDYQEKKELYEENNILANQYLNKLKAWYTDILYDTNSFQMPEFQIGWKGNRETQILCYAPENISSTLINDAHSLKNFSSKGEYASYKIKVHTEGIYKIKLKFSGTQKAKFKIYTANYPKGEIITLQQDNSNVVKFPFSKKDSLLTLELIETQSKFDIISLTLNREK